MIQQAKAWNKIVQYLTQFITPLLSFQNAPEKDTNKFLYVILRSMASLSAYSNKSGWFTIVFLNNLYNKMSVN